MLLAIFNGATSGGEVTFSKKISNKYSNAQINSFVFGSIAVTHFVLSLVLGENMDVRLFTESLPVLLLFALAAIIAMATVVAGFKYVEPSIGGIVGLMEIVFSVILGYFLFNETLKAQAVLGGVLILVAALVPNIPGLIRMKKNYI
jgi:drug/metabolite transporter (DMT)-like permease